MKKLLTEHTTEVVDYTTGEVLSKKESKVVQFPSEPPYIKMYIQDLCAIVGVNDSDQALLRHLLVRLDYEGYIALTPRIRDAIIKSLKITLKTLRNRLNSLVKANLIKPISRNEYQINPNYFARGDWKTICEQRKTYELTISYSEKGRTIKTQNEQEGDSHLQKEMPFN